VKAAWCTTGTAAVQATTQVAQTSRKAEQNEQPIYLFNRRKTLCHGRSWLASLIMIDQHTTGIRLLTLPPLPAQLLLLLLLLLPPALWSPAASAQSLCIDDHVTVACPARTCRHCPSMNTHQAALEGLSEVIAAQLAANEHHLTAALLVWPPLSVRHTLKDGMHALPARRGAVYMC
jgi:hypothetical protein